MSEPRNAGKLLDEARRRLVQASIDLTLAYQAKATAEAKRRADLRTADEITGKRRSCEDVHAEIVLARNDPEGEIGKAWMAWSAARAAKLKAEADVPILERECWDEINRGRYGI